MKMRILFAALILGVLSTGAQASCGCNMNRVAVAAPAAVATPVILVPAYHVMSHQVGTGFVVVGRHTGGNYDRMAQDIRHPQGAVMSYGSSPSVVLYR